MKASARKKKPTYDKRVYELLRREGYRANEALYAARGHAMAKEHDLHFYAEDEQEPWDGEPPAPKYLLWIAVYSDADWDHRYNEPKRERGSIPLASLGMVGVNELRDPYLLYEEGVLYQEAAQGLTVPMFK